MLFALSAIDEWPGKEVAIWLPGNVVARRVQSSSSVLQPVQVAVDCDWPALDCVASQVRVVVGALRIVLVSCPRSVRPMLLERL